MRNLSVFLILLICSILANGQNENAPAGSSADTLKSGFTHHKRKEWPPFVYPKKQFFFQGQAVVLFIDAGCRFTAGYRLGQFAIVGGGIGIEGLLSTLQVPINSTDPFEGAYLPIFAHYEGDILKKRLTPYYAVEAGYGVRFNNGSDDNSYIVVTPLNHPVYRYSGGFTGAVDFGIKLYANHNIYATWSLALDMQQAVDKYSNYYYNSIGEYIKVSYSSPAFLLIPGFKIACGF